MALRLHGWKAKLGQSPVARPGPSTDCTVPASTATALPRPAKPLTGYRPFWAKRFGTAPFLPMSRAEMDTLGWDSCDIVIVSGDAYVDHPSFGMAVIGRVLEAQGFRVGIIAQPDWQSAEPFKALGQPNLFFGVTAGNMDSMINRYTADRKIRSDDAYTPGDVGRQAPGPRRAGVCAALPRGLQGRADRAGRHRRQPAPHRALRLLAGQGTPLDPGRQQGRPAAVRQCRASHRRDRTSTEPARAGGPHHRCARHGVHATQRRSLRRGLVRDRFQRRRHARPRGRAHQPVPEHERAGRGPGRELREGRRHHIGTSGRAGKRRPAPADHLLLQRRAQAGGPLQAAAARAHGDPTAVV